jgi:hypothetical protein
MLWQCLTWISDPGETHRKKANAMRWPFLLRENQFF